MIIARRAAALAALMSTSALADAGPSACRALTGNAQAICYRNLPMGPVSGPAGTLRRGIAACPTTVPHYISLRGRNVGRADAVLTIEGTASWATPNPATTPQPNLSAMAACVGPDCRFIRLDLPQGISDQVRIGFNFPGRPQTQFTVQTSAACPIRRPIGRKCPPGPTPPPPPPGSATLGPCDP